MPKQKKSGLLLLVLVGAVALFALRFRFENEAPDLERAADRPAIESAESPRRNAGRESRDAGDDHTGEASADTPPPIQAAFLTGRAVDVAGRPLPGVRVLAVPADSTVIPDLGKGTAGDSEDLALTDEQGAFRLTVPNADIAYAVFGSKAGYVPVWVDEALTTRDVVLPLDPGKTLEGRVLDIDEKPVPGARIAYRGFLAGSRVHVECVADERGRYRLAGIPYETADRMGWIKDPAFFITADGFAPRRVSTWFLQLENSGPVIHQDFVLSRGGSLRITVVDGLTNAPLQDARVTLHPNGVDAPGMSDLDVREPRDLIAAPPVAGVATDVEGQAVIRPFPAAYGGLLTLPVPISQPRWGYVRASLSGYAPGGAPVSAVAKDGDEVTVELALYPATALEGRILGPDGRPQKGALVTAEIDGWLVYNIARFTPPGRPPPDTMIYFIRQDGQKGRIQALTDGEGRFHFPSLPVGTQGTARVRLGAVFDNMATSYAWVSLERGGSGEAEDLTLTPSRDVLLVHGHVVTEKDEPVRGARVTLDWGRPVRTDAEGRFQFYTEGFDRRLSRSPVLTVKAAGFARWKRALPRDLPEGGIRIVLVPPHTLGGRVLDADGHPVDSALVSAESPDEGGRRNRYFTQTDSDGRFLLKGLPKGPFSLQVRDTLFDLGQFVEKAVPAGKDDLLLRFSRPAPLVGTVHLTLRDARSGDPVLAPVEILFKNGNIRRPGVRRSLDTFVVARAPQGQGTLTVKAPGYVKRTAVVTVTADATTNLELRLEPAIPVTLDLEIEEPEEAGWQTLSVRVVNEGGATHTTRVPAGKKTLVLDTLGPGRWTITARNRHDGRRARATATPLVLELRPGSAPVRATLTLTRAGVVVIPLPVLDDPALQVPASPGSDGKTPTPESLKTYFDVRKELMRRAAALTVTARRGETLLTTVHPSNDVILDAESQRVLLRLPLPVGPCRIQILRGEAVLLDRRVDVAREGVTKL